MLSQAVCGLGLYESRPSGTDLRQHATLAMKKQHESHMTIAEHLIDKEGADINSEIAIPVQLVTWTRSRGRLREHL